MSGRTARASKRAMARSAAALHTLTQNHKQSKQQTALRKQHATPYAAADAVSAQIAGANQSYTGDWGKNIIGTPRAGQPFTGVAEGGFGPSVEGQTVGGHPAPAHNDEVDAKHARGHVDISHPSEHDSRHQPGACGGLFAPAFTHKCPRCDQDAPRKPRVPDVGGVASGPFAASAIGTYDREERLANLRFALNPRGGAGTGAARPRDAPWGRELPERALGGGGGGGGGMFGKKRKKSRFSPY